MGLLSTMKPWAFLTFLESIRFCSWKAMTSWECYRVACWMLSSTSVTCLIALLWQLLELFSKGRTQPPTVVGSWAPTLHSHFALLRALGYTVHQHRETTKSGMWWTSLHCLCSTVTLCMQNTRSHTVFLMPYGTGLPVVGQKLCVLDWLFCNFTAPLHLDSVGVFLQEVHSHPGSVLLCLSIEYLQWSRNPWYVHGKLKLSYS